MRNVITFHGIFCGKLPLSAVCKSCIGCPLVACPIPPGPTLRRAKGWLRVSKGARGKKGRAYDARDWLKQGQSDNSCRAPIRNQPRAGGWENRRIVSEEELAGWQEGGVYSIAQYTTTPPPPWSPIAYRYTWARPQCGNGRYTTRVHPTSL